MTEIGVDMAIRKEFGTHVIEMIGGLKVVPIPLDFSVFDVFDSVFHFIELGKSFVLEVVS
jgi:hypothetical protein